MGRIGSLYKKNMVLGVKDVYVLLEIGFAVVMTVLLLFVIPEDVSRDPLIYIYDESNLVENFVAEFVGLDEAEETTGEFYVNSRDEVVERMTEERTAMGLTVVPNDDGTYDVELLTQPYTTEAMVEYIGIDLEDLIALIAPPYDFYPQEVVSSVRVEALQSGLRDDIPFNQRIMPMVLMFYVGILGLFIMISLIGQERSELTLKAFLVSPASLWQFLVSKHLVLLTVGTATFSILYLPVLGVEGYLPSLLIMLLTILFGSAIGTFLGAVFDTPMTAMLWVLLLMIVLGLPGVSLLAPTFSPGWLRIIPTYHTLFGLDAAMFPDNNNQVIWQSVGILAAVDAVLLSLSFIVFGSRIKKEA